MGVGKLLGSRGKWAREFRRTHSLRSFRPPVEVTSIGEEDSDAENINGEGKETGGDEKKESDF